ncbi:glycosyltransferase [Siccirubricoccus sp. KC 17139]|uniref:Glycosyltransferase n=1 Tax=Siccirubricoccus soli TaxID=2899147 RepID=A0ABT1D543_9PROT|nr:glycosyltransferase [Siccirubricoccus soli]MCO6417031.1 glycosyltransferase [Siccirubricoccus soli]MCP2683166.1 glycosyltransferase [Siccirubricoccus soli]
MSAPALPPGGGILYDISRLIARHANRTPTGIDRVDLRYALCAAGGEWGPAMPVAQRGGAIVEVPRSVARRLLAHLAERWIEGGPGTEIEPVLQQAGLLGPASEGAALAAAAAGPRQFAMRYPRCIYLNASHHGLSEQEALGRLLHHVGGGGVFFIHDLIPIEFPEYVAPGDKAVHEERMRTALSLGSALIVNSAATQRSVEAWAAANGFRCPPIHVARIGIEKGFEAEAPAAPPPIDRPYFVCVGTIEPRKNHITLLHLWRAMAQELPAEQVPKLVLIGRRGWECQHVLAMLDRCEALRPHVIELSGLSDAQMRAWLQNARAVLFPTFTEGWGIPVVEALALRVPVICSDIPVLREASQGLADPVDPLDARSWRERILTYAAESAEARAARRAALARFTPPAWDTHLTGVRDALHDAMRGAGTVPPLAGRKLAELPAGSVAIAEDPDPELDDFSQAVAAGDAARGRKDWIAAARAYRQALHQQPGEAGIWVQYGHMLKEAGNLKAAHEAYNQALSLMPRDADLHLQLGHLFKLANQAAQALAHYEMALALDHTNAEARRHVEWGQRQLASA